MSLRWGLLSTANINRALLDSGHGGIVAVASRSAERAEAYAREHGIERAHGSYEALLADPEVDAIYNPLPNSMHVEWSIRALEAGKHVLCEKPMSRHPADVDRAFDVGRARGPRAGRGVHVPPQPADRSAPASSSPTGAIGAAAGDPRVLLLRPPATRPTSACSPTSTAAALMDVGLLLRERRRARSPAPSPSASTPSR